MKVKESNAFGSFLEIVGNDVDSSYSRPIIHDVVYDATHIS